jgi:hypothetical protein
MVFDTNLSRFSRGILFLFCGFLFYCSISARRVKGYGGTREFGCRFLFLFCLILLSVSI